MVILNTPANNTYINKAGTSSIIFNWSSIYSASKYEFLLQAGSTTIYHDTLLSNSVIHPLTQEGVYSWTIKAMNSTSSTQYSTAWTLTVDTTRPAAPILASPANTITVSVASPPSLVWTSATESVMNKVYIYNNSNDSVASHAFKSDSTSNSTYNGFTTGVSGTTYYWNVRSRDAAGNYSNYSKRWQFKLQ
jgi:hypothetical protein